MHRLRRHVWWLLPEALAITGLAVALVVLRPMSFEDRVAQRVEQVLERLSPAEHHSHGHDVAQEDEVVCAVELLGMEPAGARRLEDVSVVYAYYLCAAAQPGTEWDFASRISGPVVVALSDPPRVQIAESGLGYPDRVRAMIPDALEARAFAGFSDPARADQLRMRYDDEIAVA